MSKWIKDHIDLNIIMMWLIIVIVGGTLTYVAILLILQGLHGS